MPMEMPLILPLALPGMPSHSLALSSVEQLIEEAK